MSGRARASREHSSQSHCPGFECLSLEDLRIRLASPQCHQPKELDGLHQALHHRRNDQLVSSNSLRPVIIAYRMRARAGSDAVATCRRRGNATPVPGQL